MVTNTSYRLNRHYRFEKGSRKYVVDFETNDIIQVNDVEWEILDRYETQTKYQIVEGLKDTYKIATVFDGIERLERLGEQGSLLSPIDGVIRQTVATEKPKLLVPFHFTQEKISLDYTTNLNRYQLLTNLAQFADLETLTFSETEDYNHEQEIFKDFGDIRIRIIETEEKNTFSTPWYATDEYDGILLLSQFLTDDPLYYRVPDIPIVHCIEGGQKLQVSLLEILLTLCAFQRANDTLVVKASWMKKWLDELGVREGSVHVIPDGINVVKPIGKPLAKQHTAALFDKPILAQQPVVGLISGLEPNYGAKLISEFAYANPHLAIFVYDPFLAVHYTNPPSNVVIYSADDEETHSVLPIFFQALDLVCFPAIPRTPLSLVLEAMAYGTPCVAMTKYGIPSEIEGAGTVVKSEGHGFNFRVPISELSDTVNQWLKPSPMRTECENVARSLTQEFTWEKVGQKIIQLFKVVHQQKVNAPTTESALFPSIFCRRYDPGTGIIASDVYRVGTNRYEDLETALVEMLAERHTSTEINAVFKHFRWETFAS